MTRNIRAGCRARSILLEALEPRRLLADAVLVKDVIAGPDSSVTFGSRTSFNVSGTHLFYAGTAATSGMDPWVSDGPTAGTHILADLNNGGSSAPYGFTPGPGGTMFFIAKPTGSS